VQSVIGLASFQAISSKCRMTNKSKSDGAKHSAVRNSTAKCLVCAVVDLGVDLGDESNPCSESLQGDGKGPLAIPPNA
jgi:hypothetical protein